MDPAAAGSAEAHPADGGAPYASATDVQPADAGSAFDQPGGDAALADDAFAESSDAGGAEPPMEASAEWLFELESKLEQVTVTATKSELPVRAAPSTVTVVTRDELRRGNYRTVAEALSRVAGLYVVDDWVMPSAQVRGFSGGARGWSRGLKVMIDGQPVLFRTDSTVDLGPALLPISAVERIEVVRGPASALYGANAFLGVVNVITRRGGSVQGLELSARGGTLAQGGLFGGEALYGRAAGELEVMGAAAAEGADRSGLALPDSSPLSRADRVTQNDFARPRSFFGRASVTRSWGQASLSARLGHSESHGEFSDWSVLTHRNLFARRDGHVRLDASLGIGKAKLSLAGVYAEGGPADAERLAPPSADAPYWVRRRFKYRGFDLSAELSGEPMEGLLLVAGADTANDEHRIQNVYFVFTENTGLGSQAGDEKVQYEQLPDQLFQNHGVYAQAQWATSGLRLTGGVRLDHHNLYGTAFTWRAAAVKTLTEQWYGKVSLGTSYKAPAPSQLYTQPLFPGDLIGNRELRPEYASTAELAVSGPLGGLELSAVAFASRITDKTGAIERQGNLTTMNLSSATSFGGELELLYRHEALLAFGNASLQYTTLDSGPGRAEPQFIDVFPLFMAGAGVGYSLPHLYSVVNLEARLIGERLSSQSNTLLNGSRAYVLPPRLTADLTLSSQGLSLVGEGETYLALSVRNLTDARVVDPGYAGVDYPGLGRHLLLTVTQAF